MISHGLMWAVGRYTTWIDRVEGKSEKQSKKISKIKLNNWIYTFGAYISMYLCIGTHKIRYTKKNTF